MHWHDTIKRKDIRPEGAPAEVLEPGSEQYPAPRPGDPAALCSHCGAPMTFHPTYLADGGTWTCACAAGWAKQKQQLRWFLVMIVVYVMIAGLAV